MKNWLIISLLLSFLILAGCGDGSMGDTLPGDELIDSSRGMPEAPATDPPPSQTPQEGLTQTPADTAGVGNADVVHVRAVQEDDLTWTFHVTVRHPDQGWEDYADGWDVVTPGGKVLKADPDDPFTRLLHHPHVDEQPFTRSQDGIKVPPDVKKLTVRAHDLVDGYGGQEVIVDLSQPSGEDYEVER